MLENGCWTLDLGWRLSFASCRMLETPRNRLPTAKPTNIQHLTSQHPLLSDRDDLDIALPALDVDADGRAITLEHQVDTGVVDPQVADFHMLQRFRQKRVLNADLLLARAYT